MMKTKSNNWEIEVKESSHVADSAFVVMHTDDGVNSLNIHLGKDGTVCIKVFTHDEDNTHAKVNKKTYKLKSYDDTPFTSKHTEISCEKTSLELIKVSK